MKYIKTFEEKLYQPGKKLLCINNNVGELEDKYDFTIGKFYNIHEYESWWISFIDDKGVAQFFKPSDVSKNFSTA